jgi:hypothetical protein
MSDDGEARFPALDGLRGFAALYVMVCHYGYEPRSHATIIKTLWAAWWTWDGAGLNGPASAKVPMSFRPMGRIRRPFCRAPDERCLSSSAREDVRKDDAGRDGRTKNCSS